MTIYDAPPAEQLSLTKHLTAERKVEVFGAGHGTIVRSERLRRQNHWFDARYNGPEWLTPRSRSGCRKGRSSKRQRSPQRFRDDLDRSRPRCDDAAGSRSAEIRRRVDAR